MHRRTATALSILVVEDEKLIREVIAGFLKSEGCTVFEAATGEDAVAYLENGNMIDVVFTDIRLGGKLNGWDVAEAFQRMRPDVRIVYTSGNVLPPRRDVIGSVFIAKPYDPEAVLSACQNGDPS